MTNNVLYSNFGTLKQGKTLKCQYVKNPEKINAYWYTRKKRNVHNTCKL